MKLSLLKMLLLAGILAIASNGFSQESGKKIFLSDDFQSRLLNMNGGHSSGNLFRDVVACGTDTIVYPYFKELAFSAPNDSFFIDAMVGNVRTASQAYHLTGTVNVVGVQFWGAAYSTSVAPQVMPVTAYLYTVDAANMPLTKVDSVQINVTQLYDFYEAVFTVPHTMSANFAIAVRSTLNDTLAVCTNNSGQSYQVPDYGENLAWRRFGSGTWNSSVSFFGQDLEYMIFPIVNYNVNTSFTATHAETCKDSSISFTNTSSALFHDRMFNLLAFYDYFSSMADSSFRWNYGTGSNWEAGTDGSHTYTSAGIYTTSLASEILGYYTDCKDTMTMNVTIHPSFLIDTVIHICQGDNYVFGGSTLNTEGTYLASFSSVAGCDSSVHLTLNVDSVEIGVTQADVVLTATATGAAYQWLDCSNGFQAIAGETNQSFTAASNGNYAVEVTQGSCADTSACYMVVTVGINDPGAGNTQVMVYPNPADHKFQVQFANQIAEQILVRNTLGQTVKTIVPSSALLPVDLEGQADGIYFLSIIFKNSTESVKLIIE